MTKAFKLQKHYAQFISEEYLLKSKYGKSYSFRLIVCPERLNQWHKISMILNFDDMQIKIYSILKSKQNYRNDK